MTALALIVGIGIGMLFCRKAIKERDETINRLEDEIERLKTTEP